LLALPAVRGPAICDYHQGSGTLSSLPADLASEGVFRGAQLLPRGRRLL